MYVKDQYPNKPSKGNVGVRETKAKITKGSQEVLVGVRVRKPFKLKK